MKFNKKIQYAILFALYASYRGRVTVHKAAKELKLAPLFLDQVARKLRKAGVLSSTRGSTGGFEIVGNPTVLDVINAVDKVEWLTTQKYSNLSLGGPIERSFRHFSIKFHTETLKFLNKTLCQLNNELVMEERKIELPAFDLTV